MWHMFDILWGGMWFMMFTPIIIIVLVVILIVKLVQGNKTTTQEDSSIKILKERLAKGEIDEEEYNRKIELLKK